MSDAIDEFLAGYPAEIQAIGHSLRQVVRQVMPEAQETLYASQNYWSYSLSGKARERVCYLCPLHDYVRLGFDYGLELPDPAGLLQGEGKRMRHIKVYSVAEAGNLALRALVMAAIAHARALWPIEEQHA